MSVSSGPYLSPVPFVNIQEVQVSFTPGVDEIAHSTTLGIISGGIAYSQTITIPEIFTSINFIALNLIPRQQFKFKKFLSNQYYNIY